MSTKTNTGLLWILAVWSTVVYGPAFITLCLDMAIWIVGFCFGSQGLNAFAELLPP